MTGRDVDPRFDPRFQRGYDPTRHVWRPDAGAAAPPPPMRTQGERRDVSAPTGTRDSVQDAPSAEDGAQPIVESGEVGPQEAPPRHPAVIALPLIAILCVLASGGLIARALGQRVFQGNPRDAGETFLQFAQAALPGPLLIGGVIALAAWIIVLSIVRGRDAP